MTRLRRILIFFGTVFLAAGCAAPSTETQKLAAIQRPQSLIRTELYFAAVPSSQWNAFLSSEVTPRFPDGLTWFDVQGQWLAKSGQVVKLPSRMLIIIHQPSAEKDRAIDAIRLAFKTRFQQQSVLRVSLPASTSF